MANFAESSADPRPSPQEFQKRGFLMSVPHVNTTLRSRTFEIHRDVDLTGISGVGVVADGCVFPDGTTVVRWREVGGEHYERGVRATTVVFPSVNAVEALHGHGGATRLVFHDEVNKTGHSKGPHLHFEAGRSLNGDPSMYPISEDPA
jgi:hypothetical protein